MFEPAGGWIKTVSKGMLLEIGWGNLADGKRERRALMKGIILAAGKGTRLYPMTRPVCKPLLPIYDKPMIYYPLSALLQAGIREVLIITPPDGEIYAFEKLLGDGSDLGIHISYAVQPVARGIADALIVGGEFLQGDDVCLVLGDNLFFSPSFPQQLAQARTNKGGATIFGYWVEDPRAFGVVEFDKGGNVLSLEEKPRNPKSNYIVPGLYFYDRRAVDIARNLKPSARGELEITDVNIAYMERGELKVVLLDKEFVWLDAGTADSLVEASCAIRRIQRDTGRYVACIEEIAWEMGFIDRTKMQTAGERMSKTDYGRYLLSR